MQITVEAPNNEYCNGCDVFNFNYVDMVNNVQDIHVSCRKLHVTWQTNQREVKKHHDCPTLRIERFEDGKSKSLCGSISKRNTEEIRETKINW